MKEEVVWRRRTSDHSWVIVPRLLLETAFLLVGCLQRTYLPTA
jgi:hypothetical protein